MVLKLVIMLYPRTLFRAGSADTAREATTTCVAFLILLSIVRALRRSTHALDARYTSLCLWLQAG